VFVSIVVVSRSFRHDSVCNASLLITIIDIVNAGRCRVPLNSKYDCALTGVNITFSEELTRIVKLIDRVDHGE